MLVQNEQEPQTFEEAADRILLEMRKILIERHREYGPENIKRIGIFGCLSRAFHDKVSRVTNIIRFMHVAGLDISNSVEDEQARDKALNEFIDIGNYSCVLPIMLALGWTDLPMEGGDGENG